MKQGKDRLQGMIKQAASVHVLNAVYFLAMIVLAGFALHVRQPESITDIPHSILQAGAILLITFIFKFVVHYHEMLQRKIPIEQFELLITTCNVSATFVLISSFEGSLLGSLALSLLYSFLPALLIVLIAPLTWRKPSEVRYYGLFGFLEWGLLFFVLAWSGQSLYTLYMQQAWLSISTNLVVLMGPVFLGWMRHRYMHRVLQRMHEEIYIDPLTKVANRKAYYDYYDNWRHQVSKKIAEHDGLMVLLCDVDHFKSYNDHYGHDIGDKCLRHVAIWLEGICNSLPGAELFRYGGEEFVILCPMNKQDIDKLPDLPSLADWFSGDARLDVEHARSPYKYVTLSGCVEHVENSFVYTNNALGVIGRVDHKLYAAKSRRAILVTG